MNVFLVFWEMLEFLKEELVKVSLVVIKGDVNYWCFFGDCYWLFIIFLLDIVNYFFVLFVVLCIFKLEVVINLELD